MKRIVNKARADYCVNDTEMTSVSNSCILNILLTEHLLQGEIVCSDNHRWKVSLVHNNSRKAVFSTDGYKCKNFCCEVDPSFEYLLFFTACPSCTLRLYNCPDNVRIIYRQGI